jgi:hypothetical protein
MATDQSLAMTAAIVRKQFLRFQLPARARLTTIQPGSRAYPYADMTAASKLGIIGKLSKHQGRPASHSPQV